MYLEPKLFEEGQAYVALSWVSLDRIKELDCSKGFFKGKEALQQWSDSRSEKKNAKLELNKV